MDVSLRVVGSERGGSERLRLTGSKAGTPGREPRTYDRGRVCAARGCSTVLSRYNRQTMCWQHEPVHDYLGPVRGRRPAEVHVVRDLTSLGA